MIGRLRRNHVVGPPLIDRLATCRQARYRNKRHRASEDLKLGANSWKHPTAILLDGRSILCSPPMKVILASETPVSPRTLPNITRKRRLLPGHQGEAILCRVPPGRPLSSEALNILICPWAYHLPMCKIYSMAY